MKKELEKRKVEGKKLMGSLNGWIDPKGNFYVMQGFAFHNEFAMDWMSDHFAGADRLAGIIKVEKAMEKEGAHYAYEYLVAKGWVRFMCWSYQESKKEATVHTRSGSGRGLTEAQKNTIEEWEMWNKGFTLEWIS